MNDKSPSRQDFAMLTGPEIRVARRMLGWTAMELAGQAKISRDALRNAEGSDGIGAVQTKTLAAIKGTLERAGIIFVVDNRSGLPSMPVRAND
jgi:hypothetical protein